MKLTANHTISWIKSNRGDAPLFFMAVGLPGSGKSTFLKKLMADLGEDIVVASTDDIVEREAAKLGLTYSEAFDKAVSFKYAQAEFKTVISSAVEQKKNLAIDQTNCSAKSRRSKVSLIPKNYNKICLVFDVPDAVLRQRLDKRAAETGKIIPPFIVKSMANSWQSPTKDDGFHHIIEIKHEV